MFPPLLRNRPRVAAVARVELLQIAETLNIWDGVWVVHTVRPPSGLSALRPSRLAASAFPPTSQPQSSYKRGDIDTQRTQGRHGSENEQADLGDLANEIQNVLLRWIISLSQLTEDAPDKATGQPESTEDQQTRTQLRAEERGFFGQFIHGRFSGA